MRTMQWSTSTGNVTLTWPDTLSAEDADFAVEAIQLQLRQLVRNLKQKIGDEPTTDLDPIYAYPTPNSEL